MQQTACPACRSSLSGEESEQCATCHRIFHDDCLDAGRECSPCSASYRDDVPQSEREQPFPPVPGETTH